MTRMLRGAYIARLDLTQQHLSGVAAKIRGQISALEALPARIELVHPTGESILVDGQPWKSYGKGRLAKRWTYYFRFYVELAKRTRELDFVYIRYQGCSPIFLWMLRQLRREHPGLAVIIEVPSYPFHTEARSLREHIFMRVDRATRCQLRRYVDRIVTFSKEGSIFGIQTIETDNGVDIDRVSIAPRSPSDQRLHLLGLANLSFWHGYDRVLAGLARYRALGAKRGVFFDIVGTGTELERLQALSSELGLTDCVKFWGPRQGKALDEIMAQAHVGISSIGMHRLKVDTSNIKSREFCARGLPFVIGYPDRDFYSGLPFVMHIPPDESPLDIEGLVQFHAQLVSSHSDYTTTMRDYAERNLSWAAKMRPVIATLRDLLSVDS